MDMGNNSMSIKPSVPNDGIISHVYGALLSKDFSNLEQVLHHNWAVLVPQAFNKEIVAEERQALQSQLIYNIELFLSQSSTPKEVFAKLKAGNAPDLFCGRAFRNGEPTYSCRDCAYDPTCVLCMQCFEKSAHKSHKYRINTSSGGGYCDCGDVDAWKAFPACSEHGKAAATDNQNPESRLPEGMVQRAEVLFQCILRYSYQVLSSALDADLPDSLVEKNVLATDSYCTMLLNDEIHTYEQVISRLIKAVGVTNKEAVDFATTVDREGRAPVFTGPKATCQKLSQEIQKKFNLNDSKILEAAVMHHSFVSHQDFAQLLLKWLEEIIDYSDGLRKIFCRVAMVPDEDVSDISLLEKILLADTSFWKAVRLQFHQLFMTGVFKDVESKTQFAILLTKHYIDLYRDFVRDDHYRTVSATAVTVQVYTVTPIAKVLIEKHRLIEVILKTLLKESERWKNDKGILDFQSRRDSEAYAIFKRAQFVIHDLKYALGCTLNNPQWTPDLQSSFINGFTTFLELLTQIQGMDAAKRFTTHHIEYEMEWETAFTLQLKLTDIITLFIQHCRTSPEVLVSAYTAILRYMPKYTIYTNEITIAGHSANCCVFDVGGPEKCVSIHLPLHRLLAGLNHHLPPDVNYTSPQFAPMNCQLQLFNLLEEPLRIQVMLAQIYSEMWKRNGYSIQSQMYYYMYVKCRPEMYDRDIQLIQSVAAVMEPDSFLIHVIHKYTLTSIFQNSDSQFTTLSVKQTTEIVREMLQLLIIILGERYVEGVGKVTPQQIVQREIIHLLAISRSSHSDLDKNMPEDVNSETQLENYVREVADFTRDSTGKGMYTLMDECRALFNPCFYHYSKADQSKAEDSQKMFRKNSGLDGALPIPFTPQWTERYSSVSRLFTCDVMLHVIHTLLSNMVAKRSRIRSESHLEKVLHLITLALHEDKHEFAAGNKSLPFTNAAQRYKGSSLYSSERLGSRELSILDLLNECQNSEHVTHAPLKDLLGYVLKYFSEVASMGHECGGSIVTKKRSTENLDSAAQAAIDKQKALRAKKAAKSRSKIIEKMMKAQQKFMDGAADLFQTCNVESEGAKETTPMDCSDSLAEESKTPVALGPNKSAARPHLENYVCILCQDASTIDDDTTVVYSAFVQRSTVLSRNSSHRNTQEDTPTDVSVLLVPSELSHGVFTTTCGHAMHASCFKIYHDSVVARERRRAQRALFQYLNPAFDFDKGEFFCPLCESIANCVLPVLPCAGRKDSSQSPPVCAVNLSNWLKILTQLAQPDSAMSSLEDNCPIPDLAKVAADTVYTNLMELYDFLSSSANQTELSEEMAATVVKFLSTIFAVGKNKKNDNPDLLEDPEIAPLIWNTTAYTIQVMEQVIRSDNKPLFGHLSLRQEMCMSLLVRFLSVCHKVIPQNYVKSHCQVLLHGLLSPGQPVSQTSTVNAAVLPAQRSNSIIDIDAFHYLVSLCFSLPSLFSSSMYTVSAGSMNEQYILHLVLSVHMAQIMLGYQTPAASSSHATSAPDQSPVTPVTQEPPSSSFNTTVSSMDVAEDSISLVEVFSKLHSVIGAPCEDAVTESALENHLITASLPFLRCAAFLFSNLTDVAAPPALHALCSPRKEYEVITKYLDVPNQPAALFTSEILTILVNKCTNDKSIASSISKNIRPVMPVEYPLKINSLIKLPDDYSELINTASRFTCPNSTGSDESRTPTLCLVCGEMLCSQSYCCQVEVNGSNSRGRQEAIGAASSHTKVCGAGTGIYLRVRQCQVVLLAGKSKGCFIPAPYVDDYGETDITLRRGNPLKLCHTAYRDLHRLWLSHGVQEKVARSTASSSGQFLADWRHL